MSEFKFNLGRSVLIAISGEQGTVEGRCQYSNRPNSYFLRYKAADGQAREAWWDEDALLDRLQFASSQTGTQLEQVRFA